MKYSAGNARTTPAWHLPGPLTASPRGLRRCVGRTLRACLATAVAWFVGVAFSAEPQPPKPVAVVIESVDFATRVIEVQYRDQIWTLALASAVQVTRDGEPADRAELQPGVAARVVYDKTGAVVTHVDLAASTPDKVAGKPIELLSNPGFDAVTDAANINSWERQLGAVESITTARTGARALALRVNSGAADARVFCSQRAQVKAGGIYHVGIWARGTGTLALNVYQYHASNFMGAEAFAGGPRLQLNNEWQELRCEYRPTDKRLKEAAFAVVLSGHGATAQLDDATFTFDPAENPGITVGELPAKTTLGIWVEARQAEVALFVAGRPVPLARGRASVEISEGLASLTIEARAKGYSPGIRVAVEGHPELLGRWKANGEVEPASREAKYDDGGWASASSDREGFLWVADPKTRTAVFRQVVLWNQTHYGPDRCLLPKLREWGFSRGNFDNLLLALYSPLPFDLDGYEFVLDLPAGFELFGLEGEYFTRYIMNDRPTAVTREPIVRDSKRYVRHRIAFSSQQVPANGTHYAWLPIRLAADHPGNSETFFFHRRARGNFTELEQKLPISVLPPINGRQPRNIRISQFLPLYLSALSPLHMEALSEQSASSGFTHAMLTITEPGWGPQWNAFKLAYYRQLRLHGVRTSITIPGGFPLFATHVPGHQSDHLLRWVEATPEARAKFFDGRPWSAEKDNMFCPSYMLGTGAEGYRDRITRTYAEILARTPEADTLFVDYETHAWLPEGEGGKAASFCFCDRCKEAFRKQLGLPAIANQSNEHIDAELHGEWANFHTAQAAELQALVAESAHRLGLRYMVYSWAGFRPFWSRSRARADIAFVGAPGNNSAIGLVQAGLDDEARILRDDEGLGAVIGQRFPYLGATVARSGWAKLMVMSDDGFVQAKSWKSQILRTIAAFRGGIDLQNAGECVGGMQYWIGEATRIIAKYEDFFLAGERADELVESDDIAIPNVIVLKHDNARLLLLFNEGEEELAVQVRNRDLLPGQRARVFEEYQDRAADAMNLTIPASDVIAIEIR